MNKRSDDTCTKEAKFLSILIYKTTDGLTKVNVTFDEDTGWLSLTHMAELPRESNVQILHIANSAKPVIFYNTYVIISVGYRVKSQHHELRCGGTPFYASRLPAHAMPWRDSRLRVMVAPCATPWQESPALRRMLGYEG